MQSAAMVPAVPVSVVLVSTVLVSAVPVSVVLVSAVLLGLSAATACQETGFDGCKQDLRCLAYSEFRVAE